MSKNWLKEQVADAKSTFDGWEKWKQEVYKAEVERSKHRSAAEANDGDSSQQPVPKRRASAG